MNHITITAQLMNTLAEALENKNLELVEHAYRQTCEWCEVPSERMARINLIESVRAAVHEMILA